MNVLILMSNTGGGHRSVAKAIAKAIKQIGGSACQVQIVDVLASYSLFPFNLSPQVYSQIIHHPTLWGWIWRTTNRHRFFLAIRGLLGLFLRRGIGRLFDETTPDIVVSAHPIPNHTVASLVKRGGRKIPFVAVATDLFDVHVGYVCAEADCCVVPTEEASSLFLRYRVPLERIHLLGLPVSPGFSQARKDKIGLRKELSLDPDPFTVLMVGGAEGAGGMLRLVEAISQARLNVQLIVVAGRNAALKRRLEEGEFAVPIKVYGFVNRMPDLMHAADLLVTKAGPSTVSEAFVCGLPMVITSALPSEEGNARYVVENRAGTRARTPGELVAILRELSVTQSSTLAIMAQNSRRLGKPEAAFDVAQLVIELASTRQPSPLGGVALNSKAQGG